MAYDERESFVVNDSDEIETDTEITDDEIYGVNNKSTGKRSNTHTIMESDVDSLSSDADDDDDGDNSVINSMTPDASILKAIRRSIHNISRHDIDDSSSDHEDNIQSSEIVDDSDSDNIEVLPRRKKHVIDVTDSSICSETDNDKPKHVKKKTHSRAKPMVLYSDTDEDEQPHNNSRRGKFIKVMNISSEDDTEMITKTISNLSAMSISMIENETNSMQIDVNESIKTVYNNRDESKIIDTTNLSDDDNNNAETSIIHEKKVENSKEQSYISRKNTVIDDSSSDDDIDSKNKTNENNTFSIDSDSSDNQQLSIPQQSSGLINDLPVFHYGQNNNKNISPTSIKSYQVDDDDDDNTEKINEITKEINKTKMFLSSGHVDKLPDKGFKMRQNIISLQSKLAKLQGNIKTNDNKNLPLSTSSPYFKSNKHNFDTKKNDIKSKINTININYGNDTNESSSDHDVGSTSSDNNDDGNNNNNYLENNNDDILNKLLFSSPKTGFDINKLGLKAQATYEREEQLTVDTLKNFHGSLETCPGENVLHKDPRGLKVQLLPHQKHALAWLLWREQQKPPSGVLADDMGLGKTLTMISLVMESNEIDGDGGKSSSDEEWISKKSNKSSSIKYHGNTLVVCPASLINQWSQEIKKHTKNGKLSVNQQHGNNRETSISKIASKDIVLTTYAILSRAHKSHTALFRIKWKRVILDEAHVIRNHKSQCSEAVCDLMADKRWAMTGTPIHNKEMDLYALLKFLKISPFDDIRTWKRWVDNKDSAGHERLATVMKTLMLRRTKDELTKKGLLDALPNKDIDIIWVDMDPEEKIIYQKVMLYSKTLFAQFLSQRAEKENLFQINGNGYANPTRYFDPVERNFNKAQKKLLATHAEVKSHEILVLLLRLRQVCCHLSLIHAMLDQNDLDQSGIGGGHDVDAEILMRMGNMGINKSLFDDNKNGNGNDDDDDGGDGDDDMGVDERVKNNLLTSDNPVFDRERKSSKLRAVIKLIHDIIKKDEKVIVVSQWTTLLDIVAENLDDIDNATYKKFTGQVAVKNRQEIINSFNHDIDPRILLLSLTAGGVGLNLVGANHLILMDIHWNPQLESQAQDRIYRFGQTKNVKIYKVLMTDSIEERIKLLQERKLQIASSVLTGTGKVTSSKLTLADLKSLFGFH